MTLFGDPSKWLIVKRFNGWYICPPIGSWKTRGGNGIFPSFEHARAAFAGGERRPLTTFALTSPPGFLPDGTTVTIRPNLAGDER